MGQPLIGGLGPSGKWVPVKVDADGVVATSGGSGGGGGLTNAELRAAPLRYGAPQTAAVPVPMQVQTPATGSNWQAFASQACTALQLRNNAVASSTPSTAAAVNLRWRYVGQVSTWQTLPAGAVEVVVGITNANQVEVQRVDQSNTQIPLNALAFA